MTLPEQFWGNSAGPESLRGVARVDCPDDHAKYAGGACRRCRDKERYPRERARRIAYSAAWRARNPERSRALAQVVNRRRLHGIGAEEYDAFVADQQGLCAICLRPETDIGRGGRVRPLAVDHDHRTGSIRALLCGRCNQGVGSFADDPERLEAAAAYLRRFR